MAMDPSEVPADEELAESSYEEPGIEEDVLAFDDSRRGSDAFVEQGDMPAATSREIEGAAAFPMAAGTLVPNSQRRLARVNRVLAASENPLAPSKVPKARVYMQTRARDVGRELSDTAVEELILESSLFRTCTGRQLRQLRAVTEQVRYARYTEVVREGEHSEQARCVYIVAEGSVILRTAHGFQIDVKRAGHFGELALVAEKPRMAGATTTDPSLLLRLPADELRSRPLVRELIEERANAIEQHLKQRWLRGLPSFSRIDPELIRRMLPFFHYVELERGAYLYRRTDQTRLFAIVVFGTVEVLQGEAEVRIGGCTHHDARPWVGETALFQTGPDGSAIRCIEPSHLLTLDAARFQALAKVLPSIMEILRLSEVYARLAEAQRLGGLGAAAGSSRVDRGWRSTLESNYFARRVHFELSLDSRRASTGSVRRTASGSGYQAAVRRPATSHGPHGQGNMGGHAGVNRARAISR